MAYQHCWLLMGLFLQSYINCVCWRYTATLTLCNREFTFLESTYTQDMLCAIENIENKYHINKKNKDIGKFPECYRSLLCWVHWIIEMYSEFCLRKLIKWRRSEMIRKGTQMAYVWKKGISFGCKGASQREGMMKWDSVWKNSFIHCLYVTQKPSRHVLA